MTTAITFTGKKSDLSILKSVISGYLLQKKCDVDGSNLVYNENSSRAREIYKTASCLIKQLGLDISTSFPIYERVKSKIV